MKNIKTYEHFVNEEINLRKGLIGAALTTSLMGGMTSCDDTKDPVYTASSELTDYEIQQIIKKENLNKSQLFKIPFVVKNLPKDIDVKFYNKVNDGFALGSKEEVNYFTVYYMLDDEYFIQQGIATGHIGKTIDDIPKEKRDSITKMNFEKIKSHIFKGGEPQCVIDFNDLSVELDDVRKKLILSDKFTTSLYLNDNQINLKEKYSGLGSTMGDYYFTLLNSKGETSANKALVPGIYASEIEVVYTKK